MSHDRRDPVIDKCDGMCPAGRYCPEHGDLVPEEEDEFDDDDPKSTST